MTDLQQTEKRLLKAIAEAKAEASNKGHFLIIILLLVILVRSC